MLNFDHFYWERIHVSFRSLQTNHQKTNQGRETIKYAWTRAKQSNCVFKWFAKCQQKKKVHLEKYKYSSKFSIGLNAINISIHLIYAVFLYIFSSFFSLISPCFYYFAIRFCVHLHNAVRVQCSLTHEF